MRKKTLIGINFFVLIGILVAFVFSVSGNSFEHMSMDEKRDTFISLKNSMHEDLMPMHGYRCCLEKPSTYCIEKTPGHGEGAKCDCLSDVVNGVHPCGECIGEILPQSEEGTAACEEESRRDHRAVLLCYGKDARHHLHPHVCNECAGDQYH